MRVALRDRSVSGMLIEISLRLVEHHRRQAARGDIGEQVLIVLQMRRALRGLRRRIERSVVVERLVMRLEVRAAARRLGCIDHPAQLFCGLFAVRDRGIPRACIPDPGDVPAAQAIADGGGGLRRQGRRFCGVCILPARIGRGRRIAARLIGGLHGVDGVELAVAEIAGRCDIAASLELGRPVERRSRRVFGPREPRQIVAGAIRVEDRNGRPGLRLLRIRVLRRTGADQILMVQERAAEGPLEKIVRQYVFARERIKRGAARVVVAHRETARVRPCGVLIVPAAVDLHLMFEEAVIQIARDDRDGERDARLRCKRVLDRERRIRQAGALRLRDHRSVARCGNAAPRGGQRRKHGAVAIALRGVRTEAAARHGR